MTKIYGTSTGRYSDWTIVSLHWTKEAAEAAREEMRKKYRAWVDEDNHSAPWCSDPNETIDEYEIEGEPPPVLLEAWRKLLGERP